MGPGSDSTDTSSDSGEFGYGKGAGRKRIYEPYQKGNLSELNPNYREKQAQNQTTGGANDKYINPGSADYGGSPDAAAFYKEAAIKGGQRNDAAQADNSAGLARSLKAAGSYRGPMAKENEILRGREAAGRNEQLGMLGLSREAALGLAPSEAAGKTDVGFNDIFAARAGASGGARNLSALNSIQNGSSVGAAGGGVAATGGMQRSREIGDALGSYGGQTGQVRGQDLTRLGSSNQNDVFNAKLNDDWRIGNANLAASQAGLSNAQGATDLGWFGEQMSPEDKQFQYDQEMAAILAGQKGDEAGAQIARNRESRENTRQTVNGVGTGVLTAAGAYFGGPVGAAGGAAAGQAGAEATKKYW